MDPMRARNTERRLPISNISGLRPFPLLGSLLATALMYTNPVLQYLGRLFWISLMGSAGCGAISYILIWRRSLWLRCLDAEEAFWLRHGISKGGVTRRFCESWLITISFVIFTGMFLTLAAVSAHWYHHFLHRSHRGVTITKSALHPQAKPDAHH